MTETPAERSRVMRAVKGHNTSPELRVRRLLHGMGYRYRLHRTDLPGKPDVVFPGRRKIIFVHGCFWHGHSCARGARMPKTNAVYWEAKIERNRRRDRVQRGALKKAGWKVCVVWECELKNPEAVARRLRRFLDN